MPALLLLLAYFLLKRLEQFLIFNPKTTAVVAGLQAGFSWRIRVFLALCSARGWVPTARSGFRSAAEQNRLHALDKRNPPAGHSSHERGQALDCNFTKDGVTLLKDTPKAVWDASGIPFLAMLCGLRWGGNFPTYYDPVHFDAE